MIIRLVLAYLFGLIIPGYCTAKLLRCRTPWSAALPLSILILFLGALTLNSLGIRLAFPAVLVWECAVLAVFGIIWLKSSVTSAITSDSIDSNPNSPVMYPLIAGTFLVALIAGSVSFMVPLSGADTLTRWEFLARQILRYQTLDFYPPVTPADFKRYFTPDAFAPVISISYWWIYAAAGKAVPLAVMPFVLLQYFSLLSLAYHLGERLNSRFAGWLACGILVSSPLFFRGVMIGQETGLTALAMAGAISALADAEGKDDRRAFMLAALFAGLGALTREYGLALAGGAILFISWRRMGWRGTFILTYITFILVLPWNLRNWIHCGNPLYTHSLGIFPTNPVYTALLEKFKAVFGLTHFGIIEWRGLFWQLLKEGSLPLLIGVVLFFRKFRSYGWLSLSSAIVIVLWLISIGYTNGGLYYSMRVLTPALVLTAVIAAINLADLSKNSIQSQWIISFAVAAFTMYGAVTGVIFPTHLSAIKSVKTMWEIIATKYENPLADTRLLSQLPVIFPAGSRILADNPYAHTLLANNESKYSLVPVWSPDVSFLFDATLSPIDQRRRLLDLGIAGAIYDLQTVNTIFTFEASPFYKYDSPNWLIVHEGDDTRYFARFTRQ